ncbi:MAG: hypothetical protein WCF90_09365 [Methanomicrobiales archaeon]
MAIVAAAGVIVVVICAALFFMGCNGDPTGITTPVSTITSSSPGPSVTHHVVTPPYLDNSVSWPTTLH